MLLLRLPHRRDHEGCCCARGIRVRGVPCVRDYGVIHYESCVRVRYIPGIIQMTYSMIVFGNHKGLYGKEEIVEIKCLGEGNRITKKGLLLPLPFSNRHYAFRVFLYTMIRCQSHCQCRTCPRVFFLFLLCCTFKNLGFGRFLHGTFLLLPATFKAMAIDCFLLCPINSSSVMFAPIFLTPFFRGILITHIF